MARNQSINEILLQKNFVTQAQLDDAVRWQRTHPNEKIADILMSRGIVDEYQVLRCYAEALGLRFLENEIVVLRPEILKTIPEAVVKKHGVMPMEVRGNKIIIAVSDPHDMAATEDIKKELGDVMWYVANLCNTFHFSIEDVIADNVQKLTKRYGKVYQSSIEEIQSMATLTPTGKIVCNKCGSYDVRYVSAGPHIKATCKHCGAFIKFVPKDEFAKMNYGTDEDCPF